MVSIEELLKQVGEATTETERQWILLELQMSQMSEDLVSILWAAAVPHFFDAEVLSALRPELEGETDKLLDSLQELTFVEEFSENRSNIHELTREVLLSKLWEQNKEEFLELSKRAANYFFSEISSPERDIEFAYHEVLNSEILQSERLLERAIAWWTYYQTERIQAVLQALSEHRRAQRLSGLGHIFSLHLSGLLDLRAGNYLHAELLLSQAQNQYEEEGFEHPRYLAMLLRDLGNAKQWQGKLSAAMYSCQQSLQICERELVVNHPDTAASLNNLASLYEATGEYEKAEPIYLRALEIRKQQLSPNHLATASCLNNLAGLYRETGEYEKAEPLYLRALEIVDNQLGPNHPDTATYVNNLASLYQETGKYEEAESLYLRALEIREEQLGPNHPDTGSSLNSLASLYQETGKYAEAEPLYLRALEIVENRLDPNHPDTAACVNNLASLYQETGEYEEAELLHLRALDSREEQLGPNHPDTAASLNNLASLYQETGKYEEAERLYLRALRINEEKLGPSHPNTEKFISNLIALYLEQEKSLKVAALIEKWRSIKIEHRETHTQLYAMRARTLGKHYENLGQLSKALQAYEEALSILTGLLGSKHPVSLVLKGEIKRLKRRIRKQSK